MRLEKRKSCARKNFFAVSFVYLYEKDRILVFTIFILEIVCMCVIGMT